ncbi:MAG: glycosyltransferase family 2 protein [Chloroflexota bacterium]|nr:glycosyltransferase family 2 protein [Chloroflexota bacterium]
MTREKLSVLIPCCNNEDIIEDCLESVRWADEVVVCDSFSTDGTVEIAGRYQARVIQHLYQNSASQKNWAIPQVRHPWLLIVDTDERVTPELRTEIEGVLADSGSAAGYRIPRATYLFGRRLRHGNAWPDYQLRLFRRDLGRYNPREVHAHVILDGSEGTLSQPFQHFPHRSLGGLRRVILQRYTTWEAMEKQKQGMRFRWRYLVIRPAGCFVYRYILRRGFRDGWQGLVMAVVWTCYVFITYLKLRVLERSEG